MGAFGIWRQVSAMERQMHSESKTSAHRADGAPRKGKATMDWEMFDPHEEQDDGTELLREEVDALHAELERLERAVDAYERSTGIPVGEILEAAWA